MTNRTGSSMSDRGLSRTGANYLKELPFFCDELLPRLERMEILEKRRCRWRSRCGVGGDGSLPKKVL